MLGESSYTTHRVKRINEIINKLKKKAPIPIRIAINTDPGVNTIESAANPVIIVPQIPTKRQLIFSCKHFINALYLVLTPTNIAMARITNPNTPNPKAIQTAVTTPGIYPKANSTPIITPIIILKITVPILQAKLLLLDILSLLFRLCISL